MRIRAIGTIATLLLTFAATASAAPAKDADHRHKGKPKTTAHAKNDRKRGAKPEKVAKVEKTQKADKSLNADKNEKAHREDDKIASSKKPSTKARAAQGHGDPHPPEPQDARELPALPASIVTKLEAAVETKVPGKADKADKADKRDVKVGVSASKDRKLPALKAEAPLMPEPQIAKPTFKPSCVRPAVTFVRGTEEQSFPLTKCDGSSAPLAVEKLSIVARAGAQKPTEPLAELIKKSKGTLLAPGIKKLDPRLVEQLQAMLDHFSKAVEGGPAKGTKMSMAKVHVVSGFRPTSAGSYHASGKALDFRIEGVKNEELVTFCKTLPDVGCGYYPNSTFVHMDVREAGTGHVSWIDASSPGESPRYVDVWPPRKPKLLEAVQEAVAKADRKPGIETRRAIGTEIGKLLGFDDEAKNDKADKDTDDRAAEAPAAALNLPLDADPLGNP